MATSGISMVHRPATVQAAAAAAAAAPRQPEAPKQRCWECVRRRLVCDCTRPVCNKCRANAIVCPGYDDRKPLTWLAPGRVTSRNRLPRDPKAGKPKATKPFPGVDTTKGDAGSKHGGGGAAVPSVSRPVEVVPRTKLRTELCELEDAMRYYYAEVFPAVQGVSAWLGPNPFLVRVFPVHFVSSATRHALISMALRHRMCRLPQAGAGVGAGAESGSGAVALKESWSRLHHHRGVAIRLLNEEVGHASTRASDATIASVMVMLFGELQQSISPNWGPHMKAVHTLVSLRGGFEKLLVDAPYMHTTALLFFIIGIIGNTTTPASELVTPATHLASIDFISDLYQSNVFPTLPCPPPLFLHIISINHLRHQRAAARARAASGPASPSADELRARVLAFSPEGWTAATAGRRDDEWLLVARIYHSATALYCILALRGAHEGGREEEEEEEATHRTRLLRLLPEAAGSPRLKNTMFWPLVVAGVAAATASRTPAAADRAFLSEYLAALAWELGNCLPLVARGLIERLWESRGTGWDDVFDRPYAFVL